MHSTFVAQAELGLPGRHWCASPSPSTSSPPGAQDFNKEVLTRLTMPNVAQARSGRSGSRRASSPRPCPLPPPGAQDFNKEVLTHLTMPNVAANLRRLAVGSMRPSHRYFSGDWASVGELLTTQVRGCLAVW